MDISRYGKKGLLFNSLRMIIRMINRRISTIVYIAHVKVLLTFCSVLFIVKVLIQLTEVSGMNHMKYEILI